MKKLLVILFMSVVLLFLVACGSVSTVKETETDSSGSLPSIDDIEEFFSDDSQSSVKNDTISYQSIFDDYTAKLQSATPSLIEEYKSEAAANNAGLEGLAEICNNKVAELAEIANNGVSEMADYMLKHGSGNYDEYEEWSSKLYSVYDDEAQKIMDVYMNSAI